MVTKKEYLKKWKEDNKEYFRNYMKEYQRKHFKENPHKYIYWSAKGRAKKLNLPFDLDFNDTIPPSYCPILGIELKRNTGGKSYSGNSPSVDRIDPSKGYVKGNIQVISQRANVMKNDASPEELLRFADWVIKTYRR